jgi:hypothetical protein
MIVYLHQDRIDVGLIPAGSNISTAFLVQSV